MRGGGEGPPRGEDVEEGDRVSRHNLLMLLKPLLLLPRALALMRCGPFEMMLASHWWAERGDERGFP